MKFVPSLELARILYKTEIAPLMERQLTTDIQPSLRAAMGNQVFWLHDRALILWNRQVGKWSLLLQQESAGD